MKTETHPEYKATKFKCACGAAFEAGSTLADKDFSTEICSNCHPFYTGKQKLIDSSGRVDKFMAKRKKAQAKAEENVELVDEEDKIDNETVEVEATEEATTEAEPDEQAPTEEKEA